MARIAPVAPIPALAQAIARNSPEARPALSAYLGRGGAMKKDGRVSRSVVCFDIGSIRWRAEFAAFEAKCFASLCEFVSVHFDSLIDRYYCESHESLNDFPALGLRELFN